MKIVHPVKDEYTHDLLRAVAGETDQVTRAHSQWAFGQIKDPADQALVRAGLNDPVPAVREMALRAGVNLGLTNATAAELTAIPLPTVAVTAARLRDLDAPAAATQAEAIGRELHAETIVVRVEAVRAAQRGGLVAAIPELLPLLAADDEGLRRTVAEALAVLAPRATVGTNAIGPLIRCVAKDPSLRVQLAAGAALVAIHDETARTELQQLLADRRPTTRQAAATALGQWRAPELAAVLAPLLVDPDDAAAGAAAEGLGRLLNPASAEPLIARLPDAPWSVQVPIAWALGELRSRAAIPALVKVLHTGGDDPAAAAARALGGIGDRAAVPALEKLVTQVSYLQYKARSDTIRALHAFADRNVITPIFDIVTKRVVPPPPGAPLPLYDSITNRCRALFFLRDLGDAKIGEKLLAGFSEPPPAEMRVALAETVTRLTGRVYRPLPDQDYVRYNVESLTAWPLAGVPGQPGVELVEPAPSR